MRVSDGRAWLRVNAVDETGLDMVILWSFYSLSFPNVKNVRISSLARFFQIFLGNVKMSRVESFTLYFFEFLYFVYSAVDSDILRRYRTGTFLLVLIITSSPWHFQGKTYCITHSYLETHYY